MNLLIHLLGAPRIERDGAPAAPPRGHKAWALLAYLVLSESSASRGRLASLLFAGADDPRAALRWSLSELRRSLGIPGALRGDPLVLALPAGVIVDLAELTGEDSPRLDIEQLDGELLEGMCFPSAPEFEVWLAVERRHLAGLHQAALRERALACRAAGRPKVATAVARRALAIDPVDQACQELLLRCLRESDGPAAAADQLNACTALTRRLNGFDPGLELARAAGADAFGGDAVGDPQLARDQLDAGRGAIDAGAVEPGIACLRSACSEALASRDVSLQAVCLVTLGTALVHSLRGRDEEGSAVLHEALAAAERSGERASSVDAMRELGYVDVQAGRNASAGRWLARALRLCRGDAERAAVLSVRGMILSDRAHYGAALHLLEEAVGCAERSGAARQSAWALSLIGRVHLLRGELAAASAAVARALALAEQERWQAFLPWPEALEGEIATREGRYEDAEEGLAHAFALSCSLADPCWEGAAARATGLLHAGRGDFGDAQSWLNEARARVARVADPYQWMHAYVLDATAWLAVKTGAADAGETTDNLEALASRAGMRELTVRALAHRAQLGEVDALGAARDLAAGIDNPALDELLAPVAAR